MFPWPYLSFLCLIDTMLIVKTLQDSFGSFPEEIAYKNVLSKSLISFVFIGPRKEFPPSLETQGIHGLNFICKSKYTGVDVRSIWTGPDPGYLFSKQISKPPKQLLMSFYLFPYPILWKYHSHHWEKLLVETGQDGTLHISNSSRGAQDVVCLVAVVTIESRCGSCPSLSAASALQGREGAPKWDEGCFFWTRAAFPQ